MPMLYNEQSIVIRILHLLILGTAINIKYWSQSLRANNKPAQIQVFSPHNSCLNLASAATKLTSYIQQEIFHF